MALTMQWTCHQCGTVNGAAQHTCMICSGPRQAGPSPAVGASSTKPLTGSVPVARPPMAPPDTPVPHTYRTPPAPPVPAPFGGPARSSTSRRNVLIGLAIAGALLLVALVASIGDDEDPYTRTGSSTLDQMWDDCASNDMLACDRLYWESPLGSDAEEFGSTCGYRRSQTYGECWSG